MNWLFPSYKKLKDEELMQLLTDGKQAAFDEIYERYAKKMHFFFYKMLSRNSEKADDFMHDLFLKIIEKPQRFNPEMRFSTWIYSIAGNMCKNEYKKASTQNELRTEVELDDFYFENESTTIAIDLSQFKGALETELDKLSSEHKMIFHLRHNEHLSLQEISDIMNCPEGTVKSRLFYTIKKLSTQLSIYNPYQS
jgi:RNA polymerase sigma-70 factor (ECF subfamily)